MASKSVQRRVSVYINDKEVKNSLGGISKEMNKVSNAIRNLDKDSDNYNEELKKLKGTYDDLKQVQSEFKEEIYDTNITANQAKETFSKLFLGLSTGNIGLVKEGLNGIKGSIIGITKSALTFIATPLGATLALLTGAFASAKQIFEYNKGLEEANLKLKSLGVTASELSGVRSEIEATAETFDKEFNDIAEKANSLAKTYGISISEANTIIAQGLADGGAQNNEFLDSLGEYDNFFAAAGYSAQEFVNIVNTGYDLGIYTDKLPDALKEADLALREQTKSTRDALVNAFGASFTDDILSKVSSGEITTKTALENIAAQAKITGLSQQQQAQLTADVFKGAGEDAGGALVILETVSKAAQRELSATAKAQLELVEANDRLNKAQAELFEVEGFGDLWINVKTVALDALTSVLQYLAEVKEDIQPLIDLVGGVFVGAFYILKGVVVAVFDQIVSVLKVFSTAWRSIVIFFKKLIKGDLLGALSAFLDGFKNLAITVRNVFIQIRNGVVDVLQSLVKAAAPILDFLGVDVDKLKGKIEDLKASEIELTTKTKEVNQVVNEEEKTAAPETPLIKTISEDEKERLAKEAAERKKIEEAEAKEALSRAEKLADAKIKLAKAELDYFIASNKEKIANNGLITEALIDQEVKRLTAILDKQQEFNAKELARKLVEAEEKAKSEEEARLLKEALTLEYLQKDQLLELEYYKATDALKDEYDNQQKALKAEQALFQKELDLENAATEFEEQRIRLQQQYDTELQDLKDKKEKQLITEDQYNQAKTNLDKQTAEDSKKITQAETRAKAAAFGDLFGNIAQLLGENTAAGKAAALAEVAISQGLAVARVWSAQDTLPSPFNIIAKVAQTALAIGNVVSAAKQINSVKTPKFFYGGPTGNNAYLGNDQFGKVTGVVHDNEYVIPKVMTQDPQFADTIGWLEQNRQQKLGRFFNGGPTSDNATVTTAPQAASQQNDIKSSIDRLNALLSNGIMAKMFFGYQEADQIKDLITEIDDSTANGTLT